MPYEIEKQSHVIKKIRASHMTGIISLGRHSTGQERKPLGRRDAKDWGKIILNYELRAIPVE